MKKKTDIVFTSITLLLGIIHVALTPTIYEHFTDEVHIFIGMRLAFLFLACINFARLFTKNELVVILSLICNMLCLIFLISPVLFLGVKEPQGFIAIVVVLILAIFSLLDLNKFKTVNV